MKVTDYRSFGRTGLQVSPITLGAMMFGRKTDLAESCRIVDRAIDGGINIIDTADKYSIGRCEEFVGEALARNERRDRVILCTKVHYSMDDSDPNSFGNTRHHIIAGCEASLRRLRRDHIDLYQIHRPQREVPIDETLRALDDLVRSGKVRYIGCSTFSAWQVVEALWCAKEHGLHRFVSEQPPYNLLDRRIERELLPMCRTYGLAVIPWGPLAGGLLTGKYSPGQPPPPDTRYSDHAARPLFRDRWSDSAFAATAQFNALASAKGCPLSHFALAWLLQQPGVTSPIVGVRTVAQLENNLHSLDVTLTAAELARIDEIVPPGTHVAPYYESELGPHPHRW